MSNAKAMRKVRDKREKFDTCSRCGKDIGEKRKGYRTCAGCGYYLNYYKENGCPPPKKEFKVISRSPVNKIKNKKLVNAMKEKSKELDQKIGTKKLAEELGISSRSIQRYIFEGAEPSKKFRIKINNYFNKKIYNLECKV